jgi:PAS domain S-box-containing protein
MSSEPEGVRRGSRAPWLLCIALVSAALGLFVSWKAPGLDLYARDWLMRARGPIAPPNDIVIVAIDEASIARYGRFPWPRSVISRTVDAVASAHPKVIAVDVLFSEPTEHSEDNALADSIKRAGNVVSAAQLVRASSGEVVWLRPIPSIQDASTAIGHVNVSTELEGVARELLVREADDEGHAFWAMPIEAIRVADGASMESVRESAGAIRVGSHSVPMRPQASPVSLGSAEADKVRRLTAQRMTIDFVGPAGSFSPYTFGVADLLGGRVTPGQLQGKYVLIGATAASLGDRLASPFVHIDGTGDRQNGSLMPGVEVLANSMNTILRSRFYSGTPDWLAFLSAAIVALIVAFSFSIEYSSYESLKQIAGLAALLFLLVLLAYLLFTRWLIVPPFVPALVSFSAAAPLALVRRGMIASTGLDARIRELGRAEAWLWPSTLAGEESRAPVPIWSYFPRGLEWKSRALGALNRKLLARARFVDQAMRSVEDGLMVGGLDGRIVFVNRRAIEILGSPEPTLLGKDLLVRLGEKPETTKETLARLFQERIAIEREIILGATLIRHYNMRLSPVVDDTREPGEVIGLVASLSDITKQQELQQMKTDVMALVTHELRTPLTAIQGISEVLTQFDVDPSRRHEMHAAINDEAKRLARMIDDYLDITKLESGVRPLRLAPVRLAPLVGRAVLLLEPVGAQRGIAIVRRFSVDLPLVLADSDLLARAVTNLIANAIKYSPSRTEVTVTIRPHGDLVFIDVADHGCGISQEHLERIFEKFYRVPHVEDVETPGTGLGLAMVREIMELHRGAVTVSSAPGAGSTFSLRLPPIPLANQGGERSNDA